MTNDERIAEVRAIAERLKAIREKLPADSKGLGGVAFAAEQMCGKIEAAIRASRSDSLSRGIPTDA